MDSNSLTIYAQSTGDSMGSLTAQNVGYYNAGIGSNQSGSAGTITINSTGGQYGAGIGSGQNGRAGTVYIYSGVVTARGGWSAAGIGGGTVSSGGTVIITGGTVMATGNNGGGGSGGSGGIVTITGGTVTATGSSGGAGIGKGWGIGFTDGTFSTGNNGQAVIFASSISNNGSTSDWSGVIFQGNSGQVYGNQTLTENLTVTGTQTLTIPENITLTVQEGVTLTNNGTISGAGILDVDGAMSGTGMVTCIVLAGNGTSEETAFQISNLATLEYYRDRINDGETSGTGVSYASAYYELTADIDMSGTYNETTGQSWTPIGSSTVPFTGTFNGGGKTISGLYINDGTRFYTAYQHVGLFGYVSGSEAGIYDLSVSGDVTVTYYYNSSTGGSADGYAGGIVGYNNGGTISGCSFAGKITGDNDSDFHIGGVVGYNAGGTVSDCSLGPNGTVAGVSGGYTLGGVVGTNAGSVTDCHSSGNVRSSGENNDSECIGGIVWLNYGLVTGCYNSGTLTTDANSYAYGYRNVGGIVGLNETDAGIYAGSAEISGCYNTGELRSSATRVGGITAFNGADDDDEVAIIANCYNTGNIYIENGWYGGIVGDNYAFLAATRSYPTVSTPA